MNSLNNTNTYKKPRYVHNNHASTTHIYNTRSKTTSTMSTTSKSTTSKSDRTERLSDIMSDISIENLSNRRYLQTKINQMILIQRNKKQDIVFNYVYCILNGLLCMTLKGDDFDRIFNLLKADIEYTEDSKDFHEYISIIFCYGQNELLSGRYSGLFDNSTMDLFSKMYNMEKHKFILKRYIDICNSLCKFQHTIPSIYRTNLLFNNHLTKNNMKQINGFRTICYLLTLLLYSIKYGDHGIVKDDHRKLQFKLIKEKLIKFIEFTKTTPYDL